MKNLVRNLYGEENSFSKEKFISPPTQYAPSYNWMWNSPVSHEETDRQLDEMKRLGIKALAIIPEPKNFRPVTMGTLMEPDYLTPPYFEEYKYAVEGAKKRGMLFTLYDEGGWPSGGACGKVMLKHPEYALCTLASRNVAFAKGDTYTLPEDASSAFDKDGNLIKNGHTFDTDCEITEYFSMPNQFATSATPETPDISIQKATDCFIELTHEAYKPHLKEYFGDTIRTVFSDEASVTRWLFRKDLEEKFEKENGYSIAPFLPELADKRPVTEAGAKARIAWFDLCSRVFCENYLLNEKAWCNQNGLAFIGHMNGDHFSTICCTNAGNFNLMRSLRCFDVPGIDVIWRQIFPNNKNNNHPIEPTECLNTIFPRYASSAAAQLGMRYALTESFGVYGAGIDFNQMRYVLNYQAVRGLNMYNFFGIPYCREGYLMTGELPYFTEKHACYKDLPVFNKYTERLSYLASLGERVADVALYMPVKDFHAGVDAANIGNAFEETGRDLEDARVLFDIADDDVFSCVEDGKIKIGKAEYSTIVVPPCDYMPEKTKEQLSKLIAQGGKVLTLKQISGINGATYVKSIKSALESPVTLSGDNEMVRLCIRQAENGRLLMLFNESDRTKTFEIAVDRKTYILDAEIGKIIRPHTKSGSLSLTLPFGKMAFLWQGDVSAFEDESVYDNEELLSNFTFRRTDKFVIGYMHFKKEIIEEDFVPVPLGDWSDVAGPEFSGSGIYRTTFNSPKKSGKICFDLGEVHASCEMFINGKSMGISTMAPYLYELDAEQLQEENTLEIRVTNTSANEYFHTKSFDKWQKWKLSPYYDYEKIFHADSLKGGLYGPIKIKY